MCDELFEWPDDGPARPLNSLELARLRAVAADENDVTACERVNDADKRELVIAFICETRPDNWTKQQLMVSLMLYKIECGDLRPFGGDIITNAAKFHFAECEGNNDHRLLFTRALAIVRPDFVKRGVLAMEDDAKASVLFECGWLAPATVDWNAIQAANFGGAQP